MDVQLWISRKLGSAGRRGRVGRVIAVTGVALSLAVMIIAVAVVVGFKREIRAKVMGLDPAVVVGFSKAEPTGEFDPYNLNAVDTVEIGPIVELMRAVVPESGEVVVSMTQEGVLKTSDNFAGVRFDAFDASHDWSFIADNITDGSMPRWIEYPNSDTIVVSRPVAQKLGLSVGDRVDSYFFTEGNLRARRLTVGAIYDTHFRDRDAVQCFVAMGLLERLRGTDASNKRVEVRGIDLNDVEPTTEMIGDVIRGYQIKLQADGLQTPTFTLDNINRTGAAYFNWLALLDTNVVVILALMACVGAFTLLSSLFVLVLERVAMIGTLKSLGATNRQISRVFMWLGLRVVVMGVVIGNIIGLGLAAVQGLWHIVPLDPDSYYLTSVPVAIEWWQMVSLNVGVLLFAGLILFIPSRMIAKVSPTATMRWE